jgi:uncharacterized phage protein (TIGR01671 family)
MKNRKIKVRVWSKPLERFLTKDEWFLDFDGDLHFIEYDEDSNQYWPDRVPEENYVVQQYTGILDKNGVEIAEGDIIQYQDGSHQAPFYDKVVVEWVSENDGWVYSGWKFCDNFLQGGEFQVVGNLLENPELLK